MSMKLSVNMQFDPDWPPKHRHRLSFTRDDDRRIIAFLLAYGETASLGGNEIWKKMESSRKFNAKGFGWQSLKERWRKRIDPNLDAYVHNDSQWEILKNVPPGSRKITKDPQKIKEISRKSGRESPRQTPERPPLLMIEDRPQSAAKQRKRLFQEAEIEETMPSIEDNSLALPAHLQRIVARNVISSFRRPQSETQIPPDDPTIRIESADISIDARLPDSIQSPNATFRFKPAANRVVDGNETIFTQESIRSGCPSSDPDLDFLPPAIELVPRQAAPATQELLRAAVSDTQPTVEPESPSESTDTSVRRSQRVTKRKRYRSYDCEDTEEELDELDLLINGVIRDDSDSDRLVIDESSQKKGARKKSQTQTSESQQSSNSSKSRSADVTVATQEKSKNGRKSKNKKGPPSLGDRLSFDCETDETSSTIRLTVSRKTTLHLPTAPEGPVHSIATAIRDMFTQCLEGHDDGAPHGSCVGLAAYLSMWRDLHGKIEMFIKDRSSNNVLREWISGAIEDQVAAILRMPMCLTTEIVSTKGSSLLFLEHKEWIDFVGSVSRIRWDV